MPIGILIGAGVVACIAFPAVAKLLEIEAPMAHALFPALGWGLFVLGLYGLFQSQVCRDVVRRRWVAAGFHLGILLILVGGGVTALCARSEVLPLAVPSSEPMVRVGEQQWKPLAEVAVEPYMLAEWRLAFLGGRWLPLYPHTMQYLMPADFQHWAIAEAWGAQQPEPIVPGTGEYWAGTEVAYDRVTLEDFKTETYPNGMPSQYRTTLRFNDDEVQTLAVNQPLRRKGLTYYQMSAYDRYVPAIDRMGNPVYFKYLAMDEELKPRFDAAGHPVYHGEQGEMPVEYLMRFTELSVRSDPGAPIVFVGYGVLILAALGLALREERKHDA